MQPGAGGSGNVLQIVNRIKLRIKSLITLLP